MKNKQIIISAILLLALCLTKIHAQNTQEITNEFVFGKHYTINSLKIGEEREFIVSVPDNYNNSNKKYPVLYTMDGDWNFNIGVIGGIRYLEMLREMPEIIVVSVKNTNRTRDVFPWILTFRDGSKRGGGADNYLSFFREELQPFINANYRTANYRILYGQSNSALTTVYEMFKNPQAYNAYIGSSPSLIRPFRAISDSLISNWNGGERYLHIIDGGIDSPSLLERNLNFKNKIDSIKPAGITAEYTLRAKEGHVTKNALILGLKDLFSGWKFDESLSEETYSAYINHYEILSHKFNIDFVAPEYELNAFGYRLMNQNDNTKKAIKVFKYIVKKYPTSWNAYDSLGEVYLKNDEKKLALKNYIKSMELNSTNENAKEIISNLEKELN
jgi:predicted alpha/beta superfamily hydrolase